MDNAAGKLFCAKLESKNLKYTVLEDDYSVIRLGFSLDNTDTDVYFFFGKKCEDMHILCRLNLKIPESKFEKMYKVCNNLNMRFRWLKFFVNEEKRVIQVDRSSMNTYTEWHRVLLFLNHNYSLINRMISDVLN